MFKPITNSFIQEHSKLSYLLTEHITIVKFFLKIPSKNETLKFRKIEKTLKVY